MYSAIGLVQIIILNNFYSLEKIFGGKRKYLLLSAVLTGIGFIIIAISSTITMALFGMLMAGAFGLTRKPLFHSYLNKYIQSGERATVLSTISMFYSFSAAIINIVLGYFVDLNIGYTLVVIGLFIITLGIISKLEEEHLID